MKKILFWLIVAVLGLPFSAYAMGMERFIVRDAGSAYQEGDYSALQGLQYWLKLPVYQGQSLWNVDTDIWNVEVVRGGANNYIVQKNAWLRLTYDPKYSKGCIVMKVGITREKSFAILEIKQFDKKGNFYSDYIVTNPIYYNNEPQSVFEALYDLYFRGELKSFYGDQSLNDGTGTPGMAYSAFGIKYSYRWKHKESRNPF